MEVTKVRALNGIYFFITGRRLLYIPFYLIHAYKRRNMIISYESSVDMSSFKPSGSGVSDLFGLSDFDSLLFRTGFSSKDEEKTDSDDTWNRPNSKKKHAAFDENTDEEMHNEPLKKSKNLSSTSISTNVIDNNKFVDECVRLPTDKEVELHKDLKKMTNKCIDLQLLINTEQDHIDTMSDKSDGLAKEMISLRREKVTMTHNSKATSLKIQEVRNFNSIFLLPTYTLSLDIFSFLDHRKSNPNLQYLPYLAPSGQ